MDGNHLVVFVQGQHYVIGEDGHADLDQPVTWNGEGYVPRQDDDPQHNKTYGTGYKELVWGAED